MTTVRVRVQRRVLEHHGRSRLGSAMLGLGRRDGGQDARKLALVVILYQRAEGILLRLDPSASGGSFDNTSRTYKGILELGVLVGTRQPLVTELRPAIEVD